MLFTKPIFYPLALMTVATATFAEVASAATFNFSYTSSVGTITATLDGTLQPDNNTVIVSSVTNPTFSGSPAPALPFLGSGSTFTLGQPALLSLDGSILDFLACTDDACTDGFLLSSALDLFNSGTAFGAAFESIVLANYSLTPAGVPEPGSIIGLAALGLGFMGLKRKKAA
jgi:hypothetical protein